MKQQTSLKVVMSNEYNENMNLKLLGYGLEIKKEEGRTSTGEG